MTDSTSLGKVVHLGCFLLPEYHRQAYMLEAVRMVTDLAFAKGGCVRITAGCYKENDVRRKVMEKNRFRKEGERIGDQYHDGVMKDRLDYAINKYEFMDGMV